MPLRRLAWPMMTPMLAAYAGLLLLPLCIVLRQSFMPSVAGRVGGEAGVTLDNYAAFIDGAYWRYFADTFGVSLFACAFVMLVSYPAAYWLVHSRAQRLRGAMLSVLLLSIFASAVVKVYGVALAFSPAGLRSALAALLRAAPASRPVTSCIVGIGLVNFLLPIAILGCVAPIQGVSRSVGLAAQSLGANRLVMHLRVLIPLCLPGLLQVFLLIYAGAVSAFVVPWILGRGQVNFVSNLVYARFSEMSDFPSGAALSMLLLLASLAALLVVSWAASRVGPRREMGR